MKKERISEKNKIEGLKYALLADKIELPVLDITHPLFVSSINESKLASLLKDVEKKGEKRADGFQKMPSFIKSYFSKHSFVMADFLAREKTDAFLSGVSTLMLKLGPGLIGEGRDRFLDRLVAGGLGAITLRMRLRDICRCQADALVPQLRASRKSLCFFNIGGGTACDSLNTLILIRKEDPWLLENRTIEINVLDMDLFGAEFAERCVAALQSPGGHFNGLSISLRRIHYDWNDPAGLESLLAERRGWIQIGVSEGGLFEYGSDETILRTLNTMFDRTEPETTIVGSVMRDHASIDPGARAALKITKIKARMLGIDGLKNILASTRWKLERTIEGNPRYVIFALRKERASNGE
jgi:hypothetical protein